MVPSASQEVAYTNDQSTRTLYVDYVIVNGATVQAESGAMVYDQGSGSAAYDGFDVIAGREMLDVNGALRFVKGAKARNAGYDANGNMTTRTAGSTYTLAYDSENRLTTVSGGASATFVYDGDGNLVKKTLGTANTSYVGSHFEWTGSTSTMVKYYYHGGKRVAMRVGASTWHFLLTDHLGSTARTATSSGTLYGELRYKAWGENRYSWGTTPTTYHFTGQREEGTIGLYFYNARWYDTALGRFTQADTVVPSPSNPQALSRYAYTLNNPVKYTDPSGHANDAGGAWNRPREIENPESPLMQAADKLASVLGVGVGDSTEVVDFDYATEQWVAKIDLSYEATLVGSAPESTLTIANTYQKIGPWKRTSEGELRVQTLPIEAHVENVHISGVFEFGISEHSSLSSVKFSVGAEITHEMYGSKVNPGLEQVLTVSGEIRPNRAALVGALVVSAVILWEAPWSAPGVIEGWRRATQGGW